MTLFKQFLIGALFFTLVILGVVGYNDYARTNEFISNQLGANARHTAISLSMVILNEAQKSLQETSASAELSSSDVLQADLAPSAQENLNLFPDSALKNSSSKEAQFITKDFLEATINPVFDSGYYSQISFKDPSGKVVFQASNDKEIYGVNDWFVNLVNIPTPVARQEIRLWNLIGSIEVQISPAFAYSQMYALVKDLLISLFAIYLCAFLVLYFSIKAMLAPLFRVRRQAEAILEREFIIQDKLPLTEEIRKVVLAMNTMVGKVRSIFEKEAQMLENYNELLYMDESSRLFNRRYFVNKFKEFQASEEYSSGYFLLLSIKETYTIKRLLGYAKSEQFIKELAQKLLASNIAKAENIYRLNENDFAMIVHQKRDPAAEFRNLLEQLKAQFVEYDLDEQNFSIKAAFSHFDKCSYNELLAKTDLLLMQVGHNFGLNGSLNASEGESLGKQGYKDFIHQAILNDEFCFVSQDALEQGELLHEELYLRLKMPDASFKSAAYFMPIINELNLSEDLDFYVVAKALKYAQQKAHTVAVNISADFIKPRHYARLSQLLDAHKTAQISFELAMNKELNISEVISFAKFIRRWNIQLGLDHFGLDKENLMILNELNVSYVKTPVSMLLDLLEDQSTSGAANSLEIILNSKNVKIIAIGIENELSANAASKIGLNAQQGRYISEIKDV